MTSIRQAEVFGLLKKYAVILILFQILSQFVLGMLPWLLSSYFSLEEIYGSRVTTIFISSGARILLNVVVGLFILSDMNKEARITWIIFAVALFHPPIAAVFLIITRIVGFTNNVNDNSAQDDQNILDYKLRQE